MRAWNAFVEFLGREESATGLALFRIGMGLSVLLTVGSVWMRGLVPVIWYDRSDGGIRSLDYLPWLFDIIGAPTPSLVDRLVYLCMAMGVVLVLGFGGRVAALVATLLTSALLDLNGHAGGSYDELLINGLWLLVLSGGTATLSVDAWVREEGFAPSKQIAWWPRWLILFQLSLMYCTTGLQKVSAYWVPGGESSALYYIMQQPTWQRIDMRWVAPFFPLTQIATFTTWVWEVFNPIWLLAIWFSATAAREGKLRAWSNKLQVRWVFAAIGVGMHAVIWATMEVGPFSPISLCYYVMVFHPEEIDRLIRR